MSKIFSNSEGKMLTKLISDEMYNLEQDLNRRIWKLKDRQRYKSARQLEQALNIMSANFQTLDEKIRDNTECVDI